jgi:outer membrane protein TolC
MYSKMKRKGACWGLYVLIGTCLAFSFHGMARGEDESQTKHIFTLKQLIDLAIAKSPEMGESRMEIEAAKSDLAQAEAAYYPQVDITALTGPVSDADEPEIRNNRIHDPSPDGGLSSIGIFGRLDFTVTQPIYTFGKLFNQREAARLGAEAKEFLLLKKRLETALRVKQLYYALILSRQGVGAADDAGEFFDDARKRIERLLKLESTNVVESDLYKVDAYRAASIRSRAEAEKGAKLAYFALKSLIRLSPDEEFDVLEKRLPFRHKDLDDLKEYIRLAFENRPEYKQIQKAVEAKEFQVKAARSDRYPSFFAALEGSFAGSPNREKFDNPYISDEFNHSYVGILAGMKWELDCGIKKAREDKMRAEYRKLLHTKSVADMNIPIQIAKIYQEILEWEKAAESYHKAAVASRKWVVSALGDFDMGVGTAENLLYAIEKYGENESKYIESLFNYHLTIARLQYAVGKED